MGLILTRLDLVPTESNPIRLSTFGFTMEGRTKMAAAKAKKPAKKPAPAAKKPAAKKKKK
jgi:hypothetical protein